MITRSTQRRRLGQMNEQPRVKSTRLAFLFVWLLALANLATHAQEAKPDQLAESTTTFSHAVEQEARTTDGVPRSDPVSICQLVEEAAAANRLPFEFFARVIWQESRFRSDAVGPVTRSGRRAQGIAQFMPLTAAERFLRDPFDPAEALPKSAEFLRELQEQFGNLGLAAAAYNAGPTRVRDWLAGRRTLPSETQAYVRIVTGRRAEEWRPQVTLSTLNVTIPADMSCEKIVARAPMPNKEASNKSISPWAVQLIGDLSEVKALAAYGALQKKHEAILGKYQPMVMRTTTVKMTAAPTWTRVRVEADSRQVAEALCSRLRAAGETCLVQRN
jgi:Transglycosylase SLT domain/SPOR domain